MGNKKQVTKKNPNGAGRPCMLDNKKLFDKLVELVGDGNWYCVAANACGITYDTFNNWMNWGESLSEEYKDNVDQIPENKQKFFDFFYAIKKAESNVEVELVSGILANADWKAHVTYLERKYPDRWGRQEKHKVEGSVNLNITDFSELTDEQLDRLSNGEKAENVLTSEQLSRIVKK